MSYLFELDPKDEASAALVGAVGRRLQEILVERKTVGKLTQQEIANRLGVDRSRVNKCFSGYHNLTLTTLAELVWAMDAEIEVSIRLKDRQTGTGTYEMDRAGPSGQIAAE
jgi:plasmid maintenance system antidote protein VapI